MAKSTCHSCASKCGKKRIEPEMLQKLEKAYRTLLTSNSKSLLKQYLTQPIFDKLKTRKTSYGSSLLDCIQSGVANPDSGCGIYAADPECYKTFADIFDLIIDDYHGGFPVSARHPPTDWGQTDTIGNVDPDGKYVISTRVRCGRSLDGYPFNPCLTEKQYVEIADTMTQIFGQLTGELEGKFYPLKGMTPEDQKQLIDDHFLFKEGDRFLQAANACRFWPVGRGIFHNEAKNFLVWVCEEDHIRIISMQPGGDLGTIYRRLINGVQSIEQKVKFSRSERFGYLTFCPTNLGTTIRASVHIKLPKLSSNMKKFEEVAAKYNLQIRGTSGEHTEAQDGVYDVSNKRRLGLTEYEAVKEMHDGIREIINIENKM